MKHYKVISYNRIEITQSSPLIPYELAHNYGYTYAHIRWLHFCSWFSPATFLDLPSCHKLLLQSLSIPSPITKEGQTAYSPFVALLEVVSFFFFK